MLQLARPNNRAEYLRPPFPAGHGQHRIFPMKESNLRGSNLLILKKQ